MKIWKIIKGVIWVIAAVLVLIFSHELVKPEVLRFLIGGLMIAYAAEQIIIFFVEGHKWSKHNRCFWGLCELVLGVVMVMLIKGDEEGYIVTCVIWAIWAFFREALEIEEAVHEILEHEPAFLSIIESIVGIVFSVLLILEPTEHHALSHIYLLFVELVTTGALFPLLKIGYNAIAKKRKGKKEIGPDEGEL